MENGLLNKHMHLHSDYSQESDGVISEILPSFEELVNQIHNIKPQQFYDNQRKLKLYDIQLLQEELQVRKMSLFKSVQKLITG